MKRKMIALVLLACLLFAFSTEAFAATPKVKSLTISGGNVSILVGQSVTLKATVAPATASSDVTWSTSSKATAAVSAKSGGMAVVTGKKAGTVTITCVSKDNKKIKATTKITVVKPVEVTSVRFMMRSLELQVTGTGWVAVQVTPSNANKTLTYSSSNKSIATVDAAKGTITAIKPGKCTITVRSANGKTDKLKVTVVPIVVTQVKLDQARVNMMGKKVTLKATCYPLAADQTVSWTTTNHKVAVVKNGVVTPKGYGTCQIVATSKNGVKANCEITVSKVNRITRSFSPVTLDAFKMEDTLTIVVDGLTGKITSTDCYQSKRDPSVVGSISKDGIKCYQVDKKTNTAYFRSKYTINAGLIGLGKVKIGVDVVTATWYYKLDTSGTLKVMKGECDDLLGICMVDHVYYIVQKNGTLVRTTETR